MAYANLVAQRRSAALEAPGWVVHAVGAGLVIDQRQGHDFGFGAQSAAEFAGAARILAQAVVADQQREFVLDLLRGPVVGVAIVHADGAIGAILVRLGAPTAADQTAQVNPQAAVTRVNAIDVRNKQVGVVAGDHIVRNGGRQRLEDGVDQSHRISHPDAHGRRMRGADDGSGWHDDLEGAEAAIVDGVVPRQGEALECHLRAGDAGARIVETLHLRTDAGQIHGHLAAADGHLDADRHRLVDVYAIVVHLRFGDIDAIGHGAHAGACLRFAMVHDFLDAREHRLQAVAREHVLHVPRADTAGRQLRLKIAHCAVGAAHVHQDEIAHFGVEPAAHVVLDQRNLQAL